MAWFLLALFVAATMVSVAFSLWLLADLRKKFTLLGKFFDDTQRQLTYYHKGSRALRIKNEMRTFILRGKKPFRALVGFRFDVPVIGNGGFDPFLRVESDANGVVMFAAWCGPGPALFIIQLDDATEDDVTLETWAGVAPECRHVSRPHWIQHFI